MPLHDNTGEHLHAVAPLSFLHTNHDDLLAVTEKVRKSSGLDADAAAATAVGLKLLSEVMIEHKDNPLFHPLRSGMREFIQGLKALGRDETAQSLGTPPGVNSQRTSSEKP